MQAAYNKMSPALGIPYKFVYAAPMVGFLLTSIRQIQTIVYRVKSFKSGEEWED